MIRNSIKPKKMKDETLGLNLLNVTKTLVTFMTQKPKYLFSFSINNMCWLAGNGCNYVVYNKGFHRCQKQKWVNQTRNHVLGKQLPRQMNLADFKKAVSFTFSFMIFMDRSKFIT